jgi:hypothetical protein
MNPLPQPEIRYAIEPYAEFLRTMLTQSQELGSMYDYLAKVILLGPSGSGK